MQTPTAPPPDPPRIVNGLPREIGLTVGNREHLSCAEVARLFSCSTRHVVDLCCEGSIQGRRVEGKALSSINGWRIPVPALRDFIRRRTNFPVPE